MIYSERSVRKIVIALARLDEPGDSTGSVHFRLALPFLFQLPFFPVQLRVIRFRKFLQGNQKVAQMGLEGLLGSRVQVKQSTDKSVSLNDVQVREGSGNHVLDMALDANSVAFIVSKERCLDGIG